MSDYVAGKAWKQEKYQRILEAGFKLFAERSIESVTMPEVAEAGNVSRSTVFRYFPSKTDLVIAISTWRWKEYIDRQRKRMSPEDAANFTGAEYLRFYIGSFLEMYRDHKDMLRFNYDFNSFLSHQKGTPEQKLPYTQMVDALGRQFHELYERGSHDGTLNTDIPEQTMFSSSYHIMLAAVTRYAVGLAVVNDSDPESELVMLSEMMISKFTK